MDGVKYVLRSDVLYALSALGRPASHRPAPGVNRMASIASFLLILGIPLYFMMRADRAAFENERALAKGWVVFRRIVSFGAALLFGAGAVRALVGIITGESAKTMLGLFLSGMQPSGRILRLI